MAVRVQNGGVEKVTIAGGRTALKTIPFEHDAHAGIAGIYFSKQHAPGSIRPRVQTRDANRLIGESLAARLACDLSQIQTYCRCDE